MRKCAARLFALLGAAAMCAVSACAPRSAQILLFAGTGTSSNDVAAIESILRERSLDYATASTSQLNALSDDQLSHYRLVIVPGGNFEEIGRSLRPEAAHRLRSAVQHGVNYLGICAGAFLASNEPFNGLDLFAGVRFPFYELEAQGTRKAAVPIATADGVTRDHYWEDGPQLSGWGVVVATYPTGVPAIVEGRVGSGWVILSGIHPEAPDSWRGSLAFRTSADDDRAYAASLIDAALHRFELPHY